MQALKKTWFISDLHLNPAHPEITSQFIALLNESHGTVDDLYILGDLFEIWIGDDDTSPFHAEILKNMLKASLSGTRLHFMRGNRDFLTGPRFSAETGCQILPDEARVDVYGTPVLLMHGDTLCTRDTAYLRARKFAYNKIVQTIFLWLPLSLRRKLAARARSASKKHTSTTDYQIMDVTQDEVARVMQKHNVDVLIHGHTHQPATHTFTANQKTKTRIVLPAWHGGGSVFEWREDGSRRLISLNETAAI